MWYTVLFSSRVEETDGTRTVKRNSEWDRFNELGTEMIITKAGR